MGTRLRELDQLPCFAITFEDDGNSEVQMVALVDDPAIEIKGMYFNNEDIKSLEFKAIKEEMKIVGPAMVPNKRIFRRDGDYEYFVTFSPEVIKGLVRKFNRNNNNRSINVDHSSQVVKGFIEQNWIVDDPLYDKSKKYGFNLPKGSWFLEISIEDKKFWEEEVKDLGKYSFSVEGMFDMKPEFMSKYDFIDGLDEKELFELVKSII